MWNLFDMAMNAELGTAKYTASWNGFKAYKKLVIDHMNTESFKNSSEQIQSMVNRLKTIDEDETMVGLERIIFYQFLSKEWKVLNNE